MAHSERFIAETVALYYASDRNALRTAQAQGVSDSTVRRWVKRASKNDDRNEVIAESSELKKESLADLFERAARLNALELTKEEKIQQAHLSQNATAAGVATDKMRLLRGEATSIEEQKVVPWPEKLPTNGHAA